MEPNFQTEPCLVLTSSLRVADPRFIRHSGVHDPALRLEQTTRALKFWLTETSGFRRIVLVDNSGESLTSLTARLPAAPGRELECLSLATVGYTPARGRSFGELDALSFALANSDLIAEHLFFVKANARISVGNLPALRRALPSTFDVVGRLSHNLTWLSTTFVLFRKSLFVKQILPYALERVDDSRGRYIERLFAEAVLDAIARGASWYPFVVDPDIRGIRGLDGRRYERTRLRQVLVDISTRLYHRAYDHRVSDAIPGREAGPVRDDDMQ